MNLAYFSGSLVAMVFSSERIFLTLAVLILVSTLVLLQDFARNIKREVFRVDDAAHEAKILRQQLLGIVHDEDALHVKLDAAFVVGLVEVQRGLGRDIEERGVLQRAFSARCGTRRAGPPSRR